MKLKRLELLKALENATPGLSSKEILEQSNSFVFTEEALITFNGDILTRSKNPFDFNAVVRADDLLKILAKFPDDEIEVTHTDSEIQISGRRKKAGIRCEEEVRLPYDTVTEPTKWKVLPQDLNKILQQAALTCGMDETMPKSTCVHVTPDVVEACDNYRLLRADMKTGFQVEVLIPASALKTIKSTKLEKICAVKEWVHFKTKDDVELGLRCYLDSYSNLDKLLELEGETVELPKNLAEIIERAEIMIEAGYDAEIIIKISDEKLTLESRKDTGWYREHKRIKYKGEPIAFKVHPDFLCEMLQRTNKVTLGDGRMKMEADGIQFVVCLESVDE